MTRAEGPELRHQWTFYFLMAVGLWNFVGAGIFGFLINLPIVSYDPRSETLTLIAGDAEFFDHAIAYNGTVWGHGAYLGPDFSAQHRSGSP